MEDMKETMKLGQCPADSPALKPNELLRHDVKMDVH